MPPTIAPATLRDRLDAGERPPILDTRDRESFETWRLPGAVNYPFKPQTSVDAEAVAEATGVDPDEPLLTVCAKGISSHVFAEALEAQGFRSVTVVEDGMEGWARLYDDVAVDSDGPIVRQVRRRATGCLGYVVATPGGEAAVVDPPRHLNAVASRVRDRGLDVVAVLDTHLHADHVSGGRSLADLLGATYYLPGRTAERDVAVDYEPIADGESIAVGDHALTALHTPGHTVECTSYRVADAVLTADTLFVDSVGRTELQFGDAGAGRGAELLYDSIHDTICSLPDRTAVLPGHFPVAADGTAPISPADPWMTTVGAARDSHDLVGLDRETFVERVTADRPDKPANYEAIIAINAGRRRAETDVEALEVGPNNCAATSD